MSAGFISSFPTVPPNRTPLPGSTVSYLEPIDTTAYTYEEWTRFAFDHPVAKDPWYYTEEMHFTCDPAVVLKYYIRLFHDPVSALSPYDDPHLEQGFWFIAGSQLADWLWDDEIPLQLRTECIASMPALFRKLFLTHPLDQACYMWWDMLRHFGDTGDPKIIDAMVAALEQILALPVRHCQISALHGLGHLVHTSKAAIIGRFLRRNSGADAELVEYANAAIAGRVL
jgi:hypothetical protein